MKIHDEYMSFLTTYRESHGNDTCVLMQVGSFFEVYDFRDTTGEFVGNGTHVSRMTNLKFVEKKKGTSIHNTPIMMCGFKDTQVDKYISCLLHYDWTIVLVRQDQENPKERNVTNVYTNATYVVPDTPAVCESSNEMQEFEENSHYVLTGTSHENTSSNILLYVYIDESHGYPLSAKEFHYTTSYVITNVFEGTIRVFQETTKCRPEHFVPNALSLILIESLPKTMYVDVKTNSEDRYTTIITQGFPVESQKRGVFHQKRQYQHNHSKIETYLMLAYTSNLHSVEDSIQLAYYPDISYGLSETIRYIYEARKDLVNYLQIPVWWKHDDVHYTRVLTRAFEQINMFSSSHHTQANPSSTTSVIKLLDKTVTPMGKKEHYERMTHVTYHEETLKQRYNDISTMLHAKSGIISVIRNTWTHMHSFLRIWRSFQQPIVTWSDYLRWIRDISRLSHCVELLCKTDQIMKEQDITFESCASLDHTDSRESADNFLSTIQSSFNTETRAWSADRYTELDKLHKTRKYMIQHMQNFASFCSTSIAKENSVKCEMVQGYYEIVTTKHKFSQLRQKKDTWMPPDDANCTPIELSTLVFHGMKGRGQNNGTISHVWITHMSEHISSLTQEIDRKTLELATSLQSSLITIAGTHISIWEGWMAAIDWIQSAATCVTTYGLSMPTIQSYSPNEGSCIDAKGLRHLLVEAISPHIPYIPNDVSMNHTTKGILLTGTNACGKSCLIKSIGIAVCMAQCGMFVPATSFTFTPFDSIFTRISGEDDIYSGSSTFMIETRELRYILTHATPRSLILGDEICKGTETRSAISIIASCIDEWFRQGALFFVATHFHELFYCPSILEYRVAKSLHVCHLSVRFDEENDVLVYERVLKDGPGSGCYGIEVCKAMGMTNSFIQRALSYRTELAKDNEQSLAPSRYNSSVFLGMCARCELRPAEHTHHIHEQHDKDTFEAVNSGTIHRASNLVGLCEDCHHKVHHDPTVRIQGRHQTSRGVRLTFSSP